MFQKRRINKKTWVFFLMISYLILSLDVFSIPSEKITYKKDDRGKENDPTSLILSSLPRTIVFTDTINMSSLLLNDSINFRKNIKYI